MRRILDKIVVYTSSNEFGILNKEAISAAERQGRTDKTVPFHSKGEIIDLGNRKEDLLALYGSKALEEVRP